MRGLLISLTRISAFQPTQLFTFDHILSFGIVHAHVRFALLSNQLFNGSDPFRNRALSVGLTLADSPGVSSPVTFLGRWRKPPTLGTDRIEVHEAKNDREILRILRERETDRLLIDLDTRSTQEEARYLRAVEAFLQNLRLAPDELVSLPAALVPSDTEAGPGGAVTRSLRQRIVSHVSKLGGLGIVFSSRSANGMEGKVCIPSGSNIRSTVLSRKAARDRMGFDHGPIPSFVVGVIGSQSDLIPGLLMAGLRELTRLIPGCKLLYLGPDSSWLRSHYLPIPILDAGLPGEEEISICLKSMDLVMLPFRNEDLGENAILAACLQHGVPAVTSMADAAMPSSATSDLPLGFWAVPESDLGQFLVSIEQFRSQWAQGAFRDGGQVLTGYYEARLSWRVNLALALRAWKLA